MRVNMDSSVLTEPRFKLLAHKLGDTRLGVIGRVFAAWLACYEMRSKKLKKAEANAAAEHENFADAMCEVGLADAIDSETISFRGVSKRIEFLRAQRERGASGGRKASQSRKLKSVPNAIANAIPNAIADGTRTAQAYSLSLSPTPDLTLALTPALTPTDQKSDLDLPLSRDGLSFGLCQEQGTKPSPQAARPRAKKKISPDWQPTSEHRDLAARCSVNLDEQARMFRDHFEANGKPMADWDAAFRNWLRRSREFSQRNGANRAPLDIRPVRRL